MREARVPQRAWGRARPHQEGTRDPARVQIRIPWLREEGEIRRTDRAGGPGGLRRREARSSQGSLRVPPDQPRAQARRHRRRRETGARRHAQAGPQAKGASRKRKRAKAVETGGPRANLVDRAFDAEARNEPWAGDIARIGSAKGGSASQPRPTRSIGRPRAGRCPGAWPRGWSRMRPGRRSEGRARPTTSASSPATTRAPSTLPGRSGAASSPMESPNPLCFVNLSFHKTASVRFTRQREDSSRASVALAPILSSPTTPRA